MSVRRHILASLPALSLWVLTSCSSGSGPVGPVDDPGDDPGDTNTEVLPPDPDGMLLEGDDATPARGALVHLAPTPAEPGEIAADLITTRIVAAVAPTASVGDVNAALDAAGATIISMRADSPFLTLRIPTVADRPEAEALAATMVATGAFFYAAPASALQSSDPAGGAPNVRVLPPAGDQSIAHLIAQGFPAAWNAARLAEANADRIPVLVPDLYYSSAAHDEIDAQSFAGYGGVSSLPGDNLYPGNDGFFVSGIIAANYDDTPVTGTSPDPTALIDLESLPLAGLTWVEVFANIGWRLAAAGDRFIVNTSIAYNDPAFTTWSTFDRAMHVLSWRIAASTHASKFVHVTSAGPGPEPDADLNSPFIAASRFADIRLMVDLDDLSPEDSLAIETAWSDALSAFPPATQPMSNVIVVASADAAGNLSSFSASGDVRAIGESVVGPCVVADPGAGGGLLCDGEVATYSGPGMAAPQVAGLAAYMLNLSPRTPGEVRDRILTSSGSSGLIDAYHAVLSLDDATDQDVRLALLDVAGTEPTPGRNGRFDENDLRLFDAAFRAGGGVVRADVTTGGGARYSRYDLNGDSITDRDKPRVIDLDGDGAHGVVSQVVEENPVSIDESEVRDVDFLCYYAYSSLYTGDLDVRAELFGASHSEHFIEADFPEIIEAGVATAITIRTGLDTGGIIEYVPGIEVQLDAGNGTVDQETGVTDDSGTFSTFVTLDPDQNDTRVALAANFPGEYVYREIFARRPNEIVFLSRESESQAQLFARYRNGAGTFVTLYDLDEELEHTEPGAWNMAADQADSAEVGSMSVSGESFARHNSDVYVIDGNQFTGAFYHGTIRGTAGLIDPGSFTSYMSQAAAEATFRTEFMVWGEPVHFTLVGTISSADYRISFPGVNCDSRDESLGCSSVNESGVLQPGQDYQLFIDISMYSRVSESCGDEELFCTSPAGEASFDGQIQMELRVSHNADEL